MNRPVEGPSDSRPDGAGFSAYRRTSRTAREAASEAEPRSSLRALPSEPKRGSVPVVARPKRSSLERSADSLPHHLTSFIGREQEIDEIRRLVSTTRLLTLTGPGGIGKTRLCHEVAVHLLKHLAASEPAPSSRSGHGLGAAGGQEIRDGVWLVELGALVDATQVPGAVAAVLGVREQPDRSPIVGLVRALRARQVILLLDGCEHLVEACAEVAEMLLRACPELRILATSREALGIAGETTFRVPPLSLPTGREASAVVALGKSVLTLPVPNAPSGTRARRARDGLRGSSPVRRASQSGHAHLQADGAQRLRRRADLRTP